MSRRRSIFAAGVAVLALGVLPAGAAAQSDQSAGNSASSTATNNSSTTQGAYQSQSSNSSCSYGCGGSGQYQGLSQNASTEQDASSGAAANQEAINANVPVTVGYGNDSGDSSANQYLDNSASSEASNDASTTQYAGQEQSSDSSCHAGCGGSGQAQELEQNAETVQKADSGAEANQRAINANVPVVIGFGNKSGSSSADQQLSNEADSKAKNDAETTQKAAQSQEAQSDCKYGCGGSGQAQKLGQNAETKQYADSWAEANQDAINANVPVVIGFGNKSGSSSADQQLSNEADSKAKNDAETTQKAAQSQEAQSDCKYGCGGSGQAQKLGQNAETKQYADSWAEANQDAINANVPVVIGWHNYSGDSSATQELDNSADSKAKNDAETTQKAAQSQEAESDGKAGSGGAGQFQGLWQNAQTKQKADSWAEANQAAENVNSPVTVGKKKGKGGKKSYR
jgi:hypothetical protein